MSDFFKSAFAADIREFIAFRKAGGSWNASYEENLKLFDNYCAEHYLGEALSQKMIDEWCSKRATESNTSRNRRISSTVQYLEYVTARNVESEIIVPKNLKEDKPKYIPYAFSKEELKRFFRECDSIKVDRNHMSGKAKKTTAPVFYRLLYSSGIRTLEARLLRRNDVDLENGVLNIEKTKGYGQHYVALHPSMTTLFRKYDEEAEKLFPGRKYFFESPSGGHYSASWVEEVFIECWEKANGKNEHHPVAYDLRHNYAIENINSWKGDTFGFHESLNNLARSMGHSKIEATLYYYTITPGLYDIISEKSSSSMDEVVKELEVQYEE